MPELAIAAEKLVFQYPRDNLRALDGLDLGVSMGTIHGLVGPNGAGKSTLLSILVGLCALQEGTLRIFGDLTAATNGARVGFAPQTSALYDTLTGAENLQFFARLGGLNDPFAAASWPALESALSLDDFLQRRVATYSGGMKSRLNLAIATLNNPKLLILDEPTASIDPQSRQAISSWLAHLKRDHNTTILIATHQIDEVESICDAVTIIDRGRTLAEGPLNAVVPQAMSTLRARYHDPIDRERLSRALAAHARSLSCPDAASIVALVDAGNPAAILAALEAECVAPNKLISFELRPYSLQDKFFDLTGKELRD